MTANAIRVLHVDDEPDFADLAGEFISRYDDRLDVTTLTSASEALDRLEGQRFDCIVSDYDMPGQSGIEFLEAVREDQPELPFILYTGKGSEEVASEAVSAGVSDYLQKGGGTSQYEVLANRIVNLVEKHQAETQLRDREELLNKFFEQSPLGVIRWDDEFNFARLNETAREILGYDAGELEGKPWEVVIPEEDRAEIGEVVVADLLDDEGGYHSINQNVRKDGTRIVCEWHNWVITDEDDDVVAVFSQFQDITERKEREQELATLEQYNREIVENAPMGIFRLDEEMRIIDENRRAEEIVGVPEGEDQSPAIGRDLRQLPSVQGTDAVDELNRLEAGETVSFDTAFESIFGKESYLIGKGVPLYDDGDFDGAIIIVADISDRKETQQILEQLKQNITDVVWMSSPNKDSMDFISDSYEQTWGRTTESLRENPTSFVDAIHPDDRERVRSALADQQRNPEGYDETYRVVQPDGDVRWVRDRASGVYDSGNLTRVIGIATDITKRREQEQELTEMRQRVNRALDVTDAVVWEWEIDTDVVTTHPSPHSILGSDIDTLDDFIEQIHPDDQPRVQAAVETALETNTSYSVEFRIQNGEGHRWIEDYGEIQTGEDGDPERIVGVAIDQTERKEREQELEGKTQQLTELSERYQAYVEHASDNLTIVDENGVIQYESPAVESQVGWKPEELVGDSGFDLIHPDDRERVCDLFVETINAESPVTSRAEYRFKHKDGGWRWLESVGSNRTHSAIEGYVIVSRDVSPRKEREQELIRQNERLDKFARIVSHDLRNPLTVVAGRLELAREEYDSDHLDDATNALNRALTLVEDLLTLARTGERVSDLEAVDLTETAEGCWEHVDTKDATLATKTDQTIRVDAGRLKQLLENLIANAVHHAGADVTVTIGSLENGFYVEDDGPGISASERHAIFEPGYSTDEDGTGFGLSIVKEIAEAHGWTVTVTESASGGARFEFTGI